jgi:beta-xylosidase
MSLFAPVWALAAKVSPALVAVIAATAAPAITPVIGRDFPDPAIVSVGSTYYAYSTSSTYGTQLRHVPVAQSKDPRGGWTELGDAMPLLPPWVAKDRAGNAAVWAPAMRGRAGGGYLLYFTAQDAARNVHCIGVAVASSPKGPFTPARPDPLVCRPQEHDSIDPMPFIDADGARYLLYTAGSNGTTIWLQRLAPDGVSPVGERRALLHADRPEEAKIIEAPVLLRHDNKYLLFYSGNSFNSGHYFVNYATAPVLAGAFVKHNGTLLDGNTLNGPYPNTGGQDVLTWAGHDYLAFNANVRPGQRGMFVAPLNWNKDGTPTVQLGNPPPPAGTRR